LTWFDSLGSGSFFGIRSGGGRLDNLLVLANDAGNNQKKEDGNAGSQWILENVCLVLLHLGAANRPFPMHYNFGIGRVDADELTTGEGDKTLQARLVDGRVDDLAILLEIAGHLTTCAVYRDRYTRLVGAQAHDDDLDTGCPDVFDHFRQVFGLAIEPSIGEEQNDILLARLRLGLDQVEGSAQSRGVV